MHSEQEPHQLFNTILFPKIFQAFRMAIQPSKLIITLLAVAVICLAGWIMDLIVVAASGQGETGVFSTLWYTTASGFHSIVYSLLLFDLPSVKTNITECFTIVAQVLTDHYLYCIIFFVITLAVLSVAGGAICRIAALQFARGEKPGLTEALRFSVKRFISFFTAPLASLAIIIFIGLFIFLLGLMGNIPRVGGLIMGIFMLLALIAGALIAVVLIGAVAGFNLMFPAVAYDDSDCFDAISRSFSYVYAKPWRMGFYTAIAVVYGAICFMFVRLFAFLLLRTTYWFLQVGVLGDNSKLTAIWQKPSFGSLRGLLVLPGGTDSVAAFVVYLCLLAVVGLIASFIINFYFSANTIIYSLMRNRVDNTALEDIYTHFEDVETEQTTTESKSKEVQPESEKQPDSSSSTE
ncbi:MAG: hypothetical protein ACYS30_06145 [Planctomycetota bacterium]|jgi:hypothetical protein